MYKHDEVEDVKTNANNTMSVPQQLPVRKLSNTQFPQRRLSNTQSPLRKLSNTNNPHMNMTRQLSKERSISTTSNLTVSSPRKPMIRKSSVPQRLGELSHSDSWCSKKNEHNSSRARIIEPKSGAPSKNRKTSDNHYYHTNKHEKPALWKDISQAFSHAECESSASSLTLMSDHIVSMTEQPSYTKPSRKSSVRSGPITAYNKKSGFASVASYIQNCNAGQKERMKSTGRILWHRSVLAVNINHARLFRENSRSAESAYRKRGLRNRFKTEHGSELDDEDYVAPINRFRKVARLVQLALIFYSGEGKTSRRKETEKAAEEHHAFFDKSDKMTFLPAFDPSLYKAQRIKELIVGSDIKEILGKRPEDRTEEEIQQVLFALRTYETFAEYPLNMQERMCRKAHYLKFDTSRIILRQGDRAEWFYYVLSGTTAVSILEENKTTGSVNLRNVGYLKRGTAFGELALLHGTRRTATVSCKDAVELIAVDKEDFVQMNQLDSDEEKEHIRYCRTLPILNEWPVNLLNEATGVCNFHFFKKGTVMAKSNHDTPFIYIVKSGHVRVLTKVTKIRQKQVQGCRVRSRTASSRTPGSGLRSNRSDTSSTCSNGFRSRISSQSTNGVPPTHGSSRHMKGNLVPLISRLNVGEGTFQDVPIQPTFLQVCVLGAGDSFGLSTLVYSEEISCGIVSLGAECIEISKEFFLKNATENYLRKLKATIRPFPSEDKLQQDIQDQKLWNNYKNTVVASVLDPSSI
ncbi:cyclic nucleotide-binding domain-containing protein 2-like isoform X3 [Bolinopsis microptera]|uniref:cyclic nucleotide-binding domain-containing protein 2-like isoform X3 n=1 Tax=Bolinopsis microptera TaxID=2820187 RepID=UPI003078DFAF